VLYPGILDHPLRGRKAGGQRYDQVTADGLLRGRGPKRGAEYYYDHAHTLRKVYINGTWLTQETRDFPEIGYADLVFPLVPGENVESVDARPVVRHRDARVHPRRGL